MYNTVQTYLNIKRAETGISLVKIERYIDEHYPDISMSDTKLSKIFKDPKAKVSIEELFAIVEAMKLGRMEILAILGEQEYRASAEVGYKGVTELIADFERRESAIRKAYTEQLEKEAMIRKNIHNAFTEAKSAFDHAVEVIQQNHDAALRKRDETYERAVTHLKKQLTIDADEYHKALVSKDESIATLAEHAGAAMKSMKWWRFAAVLALVALASGFIYIVWEVTNIDKGATAVLIQMVRDGLV